MQCEIDAKSCNHAVMLTSTGTFRGFLIQARTLSGTMVGQFSLVANETDVRLSSCDPSNVSEDVVCEN